MVTVKELEKGFDLERYLKTFKPKHYGLERALTCPDCDGEEKLWINVKKKVAWCYKCESYLAGVIDIIKKLEDLSYPEAVRVLELGSNSDTKSLSINLEALFQQTDLLDDDDDMHLDPIEPPKHFISYEETRRVPKYFAERGITQTRALRYGLGWCTKGYYWNRLIIPIFMFGQLVSFHARYMKKTPPDEIKKVLYPAGTKSNRMLYNYDVARQQKRMVLVEDPFSSMAVGKQGIASFGTKLSGRQLALILEAEPRELVICWDLDAYQKACVLGDLLNAMGINARVARLLDERDPDELPRHVLASVLESAPTASFAQVLQTSLRVQ